MLALYCKLTLASDHCVEKTLKYFVRFGPAALLASRFPPACGGRTREKLGGGQGIQLI
jgi:hypothetical protein